ISSISAQWLANGNDAGTFYNLEASTAPNFVPIASSLATYGFNGSVTGLNANTTYYLRVSAVLLTTSTYTSLGPTSTLTNLLVNPQISVVNSAYITANWLSLSGNGGSEGYQMDVSTASNYTGMVYSSVTANVNLSTLTVSGLSAFTTYYVRVGGIN